MTEEKPGEGKRHRHYKDFKCATCGREQKRYKSTRKCSCGGSLTKVGEIFPTVEQLEAIVKDRSPYDVVPPVLKKEEKKMAVTEVIKEIQRPRTLEEFSREEREAEELKECFHPLCHKVEVRQCRACKLWWCGDHTTTTLYCRACEQPYRIWSSVLAGYLSLLLDEIKSSEK